MISLYLERQSWLHRWPAGLKLLLLAVLSVLALPLDALWQLSLLLALALALHAGLGRDGLKALACLRPLLPFLALLLLFHLLLGDPLAGVKALMRLLAMILLANLVTITTRMDDMLAALQPLFRPLELFGLSSRRLSLAVTMMIRFTQVLFSLLQALQEAWRARGAGPPGTRLIAPFLIKALDMTDEFSDALAARGGVDGFALEAERRSPAASRRDFAE